MSGVNTVVKSRKLIEKENSSPYLSVAEIRALASKGNLTDLFVLNTASHDMIDPVTKQPTKKRMQLMIVFQRPEDDEPVNVTVPITFIPFNLADHADVNVIAKSGQFAKFVNTGCMRVVKPEVSKLLMERPDWRAEAERLRNFGNLTHVGNVPANDKEIASAFVQRIVRSDSSAAHQIQLLSQSIEQVTDMDLLWIMKQSKEDKVKKFAQEVLSERENPEEDDGYEEDI